MGCRARRGFCCSAALLRVPDTATADRLIAGTIGSGDWSRHLGHSESLLVNASTWGLMLTGRILEWSGRRQGDLTGLVQRLIARSGEPVIRQALRQAMRILGNQFVLGETIEGGARQRRGRSPARLSLLVRHVGGGGAHRRRRGALCLALRRGGRKDRCLGRCRGAERRRAAEPSRALGQALGAPPPLSAFARSAPQRRASAAALDPRARHAGRLAAAHHRCRRGREARSFARADAAAFRRSQTCRLERARACCAGL